MLLFKDSLKLTLSKEISHLHFVVLLGVLDPQRMQLGLIALYALEPLVQEGNLLVALFLHLLVELLAVPVQELLALAHERVLDRYDLVQVETLHVGGLVFHALDHQVYVLGVLLQRFHVEVAFLRYFLCLRKLLMNKEKQNRFE